MSAAIDFSSFTAKEKTDLLTAAKAELMRRAGMGSVQTGSGVGQSFGMMKMTTAELTGLINSLSSGLGYQSSGFSRVRPNFSCRG